MAGHGHNASVPPRRIRFSRPVGPLPDAPINNKRRRQEQQQQQQQQQPPRLFPLFSWGCLICWLLLHPDSASARARARAAQALRRVLGVSVPNRFLATRGWTSPSLVRRRQDLGGLKGDDPSGPLGHVLKISLALKGAAIPPLDGIAGHAHACTPLPNRGRPSCHRAWSVGYRDDVARVLAGIWAPAWMRGSRAFPASYVPITRRSKA